jgi:RNA polymerase sigma-70 factor (ECF subfamily)
MKIVITESQLKQITEGISFEKAYKETFPIVFNLVCKKFAKGDYDLAQEYCQTGYLRVYNHLDTFRGESSITTWVRRVVTNEIINLLRKRTLDTNRDVDVEKVNVTDEPIEKENEIEYMGKYSSKDIKNAIEDLADGYKFVFIRYYYSGKSHKEIADELGISEGTSRSQLAKARNNVKKYLENLKR